MAETDYRQLLLEHFPAATEVVKMSTGHNSEVYRFKVYGEMRIFKKNIIWPTTKSEVVFLEKLQSFGIVPRIIDSDLENGFIVMECIQGETEWKSYSLEDKVKLYFESGQKLKQIHSIKMDGFGSYDGGAAEFTSETEQLLAKLDWIFDREDLADMINLPNRAKNALYGFANDSNCTPFLLHGDYYLANTLHGHNQINAVIDPGETRAGNPSLDLGTVHAAQYRYEDGEELWNSFKEGYGLVDETKELIFYSILWDLRSYRRLWEEGRDRFGEWFESTYPALLKRLELIQ